MSTLADKPASEETLREKYASLFLAAIIAKYGEASSPENIPVRSRWAIAHAEGLCAELEKNEP